MLKVVGATNKFFVEFGSPPGESINRNTYVLEKKLGWTGILMDGAPLPAQKAAIPNRFVHFITSKNIVQLFEQHGVPLEPDYVVCQHGSEPS